MELQHELGDGDNAAAVEKLVNKANVAGLKPEDLDEIVHELASSIAADANNGGLEDQISYLVNELGAKHTERQLDKLIEERVNQTEKGE